MLVIDKARNYVGKSLSNETVWLSLKIALVKDNDVLRAVKYISHIIKYIAALVKYNASRMTVKELLRYRYRG